MSREQIPMIPLGRREKDPITAPGLADEIRKYKLPQSEYILSNARAADWIGIAAINQLDHGQFDCDVLTKLKIWLNCSCVQSQRTGSTRVSTYAFAENYLKSVRGLNNTSFIRCLYPNCKEGDLVGYSLESALHHLGNHETE